MDELLVDQDKFQVRCTICGSMQYATLSYVLRLHKSKFDKSVVSFDCGHTHGLTFADVNSYTPVYEMLVQILRSRYA